MTNEEFFIAAFDDSMQKFTTSWNSCDTGAPITQDALASFLLAAAIFSLCEKYNFKHKEFEHAATLLNQAAVQLGLEEKF